MKTWTKDATIQRMKEEIIQDMAEGRVPKTVRSFSELHDHVDANEYGGFCEDGFNFSAANGAKVDLVAECQDAVDRWLKNRPDVRVALVIDSFECLTEADAVAQARERFTQYLTEGRPLVWEISIPGQPTKTVDESGEDMEKPSTKPLP